MADKNVDGAAAAAAIAQDDADMSSSDSDSSSDDEEQQPEVNSFCCNLKKWCDVMDAYEDGGFMYCELTGHSYAFCAVFRLIGRAVKQTRRCPPTH